MGTTIILQGAGNAGMFNLIFFGLIILVFWLFIIRPQSKRQREQNRFLNELEKGQTVVTSSGIVGKVNKIEGDVVTIEVANKVFVRVLKSAVSKEMTGNFKGTMDSGAE